jgi:hypothetical protein
MKHAFHLVVQARSGITTHILQFEHDVEPELIILCEYCYHGDLKNPVCQFQFRVIVLLRQTIHFVAKSFKKLQV